MSMHIEKIAWNKVRVYNFAKSEETERLEILKVTELVSALLHFLVKQILMKWQFILEETHLIREHGILLNTIGKGKKILKALYLAFFSQNSQTSRLYF